MFKQKRLSLGKRAIIASASFLLAVLLFVCAVGTVLIGTIRVATSRENMRDFVHEIISSPGQIRPQAAEDSSVRVTARPRLQQMPRREDPQSVADDLTEQLISMFYDEMVKELDEEFPVTKEEFTQMIDESTVKDYVADKTADLITDYFNDEVTTTFEPEEVVALIHENAELIESVTGEPIPDDIAQTVAKVFDENEIIVKVEAEGLAGFMEMTGTELSGIGDIVPIWRGYSLGEILDWVRNFASTRNLVLGIVLCVVLILAILFVNVRQLPKGLRRAGYPLLAAGLLIVLNILAEFVPGLWQGTGLDMVRFAIQKTAVVNIAVFGTGLALVIAGIVLGVVLRAKRVVSVLIPEAKEAPVEIPEASATEVCEEVSAAEEAAEQEEPAPVVE